MSDSGGSMETRMPVMTPSMFPGFKFSPTDVELITYYLKNKLDGLEKSVEIIPDVEISRYEPWDLPAQSIMESDNEWFFFSARGKKCPNGLQSKRATPHGYWKATGKELNVNSGSAVVGTKRTLVFHIGRAPKGERTEWMMHEYCMEARSQDLVVCRLKKNTDFRGSSRRTAHALGHSVDDENHSVLEGCMEQTGYSEKEMPLDLCVSHSVENADSISENEQNLPKLTSLGGPSMLEKASDEDCFSDILKDDIVKLDDQELSLSAPELLPVIFSKYESVPAVATRYVPEGTHWQPASMSLCLQLQPGMCRKEPIGNQVPVTWYPERSLGAVKSRREQDRPWPTRLPGAVPDLCDSGDNLTRVITPSMFPGFNFCPTDVELITYYLKNKFEGVAEIGGDHSRS